jgi:hypothetical protein
VGAGSEAEEEAVTNDLNEKRLDKLEERVGQLEVELAELSPNVAELISAREPAPVLRLVEGESDKG